eukprot:10218934-Prorocentrum_lima.AAC.1
MAVQWCHTWHNRNIHHHSIHHRSLKKYSQAVHNNNNNMSLQYPVQMAVPAAQPCAAPVVATPTNHT